MTLTSVQKAKMFHDVSFYVLPVVASVALFIIAVVQKNTALYALSAGALGVPGIKTATKMNGSNTPKESDDA